MSITMQNLTKSFQSAGGAEVTILNRVSMSIATGELVAIQGKSGAGKSTLLYIIGCMDVQSNGEYRLDGVDVSSLKSHEKAKLRNSKFGFVMQDYALINDESVVDNIILPALFAKTKRMAAELRAIELLEKFNMIDLKEQKVSLLSGGEKQRVAIIRSLMNNPSYILADEPTGALDSKNSLDIMKIFCELHKEGKTIIIITHDDSIAAMCSRVIRIVDGEVV